MKDHGNEKQKCHSIVPMTYCKHNERCRLQTNILHKGTHLIEESQYLIDMIKESNLTYGNKSEVDLTLLMSHLG